MKWKGCERKRSGSHMGHCHYICLEGVRSITVMITGVRAEIWTRDLRLRSRSDKLQAANLEHLIINTTLRRKLGETIIIILPMKLPVRLIQAVWQRHLSTHRASLVSESMYMLRPSVSTICQDTRCHLLVKACTCCGRLTTPSIKTMSVSYGWRHAHVAVVYEHYLSRQ